MEEGHARALEGGGGDHRHRVAVAGRASGVAGRAGEEVDGLGVEEATQAEVPALLDALRVVGEFAEVAVEGADEGLVGAGGAQALGEVGDGVGDEVSEEEAVVDDVALGDGVAAGERVGVATTLGVGDTDVFAGDFAAPGCVAGFRGVVVLVEPGGEAGGHRRVVVEEVALHRALMKPLLGVQRVDHVAEDALRVGAGFDVGDETGEVLAHGGAPALGCEAGEGLLGGAVEEGARRAAVLPDDELFGVGFVPPGRGAEVDPRKDEGLGVGLGDEVKALVELAVVVVSLRPARQDRRGDRGGSQRCRGG